MLKMGKVKGMQVKNFVDEEGNEYLWGKMLKKKKRLPTAQELIDEVI